MNTPKFDRIEAVLEAPMNNNYPTVPGWYCIVFILENGERDFGPIYEFVGGAWFDESGDEVEAFYDPCLCVRVSTDGADDYVPQ